MLAPFKPVMFKLVMFKHRMLKRPKSPTLQTFGGPPKSLTLQTFSSQGWAERF